MDEVIDLLAAARGYIEESLRLQNEKNIEGSLTMLREAISCMIGDRSEEEDKRHTSLPRTSRYRIVTSYLGKDGRFAMRRDGIPFHYGEDTGKYVLYAKRDDSPSK